MKCGRALVALSFDDGYLRHYTIAKLLYVMGIKGTFYCITHLKKFEGHRLLTAKPGRLQEIVHMGHEVGSHTCTHPNLLGVNSKRLIWELRDSKKFLEDLLGVKVHGFAYPYGFYNLKIIEKVRSFYSYARGAAVHTMEDPWNVNVPNGYMISALTIKHLLRLPIKVIKSHSELHLVFFIHNLNPAMVMSLVTGVKALMPAAKFVAVNEMSEVIKNERSL